MTTARTSNLIVRETEAEDQRRITIVVSTLAPDDYSGIFERSLTLAASLLWQLSKKSYPLRLIVDAEDSGEDSGLGSGEDHLVTMLRMLALCERRWPGVNSESDADAPYRVGHDADRGYTVALMPWSDRNLPAPVDRILDAPQIEALTHDS